MSLRLPIVLTLAASLLLGAPLALAGTGDNIREGVRNPRHGDATRETQIIARSGKDHYGTRQSNVGSGGGAIYGCRAILDASGIDDPHKSTACVRANNLSTGKAFDFVATKGHIAGIIQAGNSLKTAHSDVSPLVTNATGLALGLNADRVDNLHASEIIKQASDQATQAIANGGGACPAGTTNAGGGCIETAPRAAASYAAAAEACGADGRRLVPPDVLLHARTLDGIDLGAGEMSADLEPDSVALITNAIVPGYATVSDAGALGSAPQTTATAFRCITA